MSCWLRHRATELKPLMIPSSAFSIWSYTVHRKRDDITVFYLLYWNTATIFNTSCQGLGKVSSSTRPSPLPFPFFSSPLGSPPLSFLCSTSHSLFFPFLPSFLSPSLLFPLFQAASPFPNQLRGMGSIVSSPAGSAAKLQLKIDLVHIWAKKSSSGGKNFADFHKNKMGKQTAYLLAETIIR